MGQGLKYIVWSSGQLYKLMASGESVPNEIVDDILAEAMVRKADSKVSSTILNSDLLNLKEDS